MMKVILTEDVPNLGVVGELVSVKDGYGRNYLIPQGKAVFASVRSMAELEHQKRLAAHHREQATEQAVIAKRKIEELSVVMSAKVAPPPLNDEGEPMLEKLQKLFGSITNRDLAKVIKGAGVKTDARRVTLSEPVRTVGRFTARVRLDGGIVAELPFWVIPEGAEDSDAERKRVEAAQEAARVERDHAAQKEADAAIAASRALAEQESEDLEEDEG